MYTYNNLALKMENNRKHNNKKHSETYYKRKAKREIIKLSLMALCGIGMYAALVLVMNLMNLV